MLCLVIPAYRPRPVLVEQLKFLAQSAAFNAIILVNDGSPREFDAIFDECSHIAGVHVLTHTANLGKGAALKTSFHYALGHFPGLTGIVTADADGQHLSEDVLRVAERLDGLSQSLILGVRNFSANIPWRSWFGNTVTRYLIRGLLGLKLTDTQTGLRGIPISLVSSLARLTSQGYDFEIDMLFSAVQNGYRVVEVAISTVYEPGNPHSSFNPLIDSVKIYLVLVRFFFLSLARRLFSRTSAGWRAVAVSVTLLVLLLITAYGIQANHVLTQVIWSVIGWVRVKHFLTFGLAVSVPILILAPRYFRCFLVSLMLVITAVSVGPLAIASALIFLYSAKVIGAIFLRDQEAQTEDSLLAVLLGTSVFIAVGELLVRLPWNYKWVYVPLMLVPAALAPARALSTLNNAARWLRPAPLGSRVERMGVGVLSLILAAHWLIALEPDISTDGLAMHLAIPDGIAWQHKFTFDLAHNIWAVMPMGGDWCFTFAYVIGGEFAVRLLILGFLLLLAAMVHSACRRFVSPAVAIWVTALFTATPILQGLTGMVMIENIQSAVLFAGVIALWRFRETERRRYAFFAALLFGTALHIKLGSLAFVLPGLVLLGWQMRARWSALGKRPILCCGLIALTLIGAGIPPYVIAAIRTGNPFYPFLNRVFKSPLVPPDSNIEDPRFQQHLRVSTAYDLIFRTHLYYEGQNGSLGMQFFLLLPAGVLLIRRRNFEAWSATFVAISGSILVLLTLPNARYLCAALPLFHLAIASVLAGLATQPIFERGLISFSFATAMILDLYLFPTTSWYHKDFYSSPIFTSKGRARYLMWNEPRLLLLHDLNLKHPGEAVFLSNDSILAGLHSPVYRNHWHDPATQQEIAIANTVEDMLELVRRWRVQHFLFPINSKEIDPRPVRDLAVACIESDMRAGPYTSGHLTKECLQKMMTPRRDLSLLGRVYDDASPEVVKLTGAWATRQKFVLATQETISFSNSKDAAIHFAFEGSGVYYVFTAAPNRGIASIFIDGQSRGEVDLYNKEIQWQSTRYFGDLPFGAHSIKVVVTGRKDPEAQDSFVDLDAFVVPAREGSEALNPKPLQ